MDILLKNILSLIENRCKNDIDFETSIGISRSTVSAWRRGKLKSYKKMVPDICAFFDVSTDFLLGNIDEKEEYQRKFNKMAEEHADKMVDERFEIAGNLAKSFYGFTLKENDLFELYQFLDERGKEAVIETLKRELKYCEIKDDK